MEKFVDPFEPRPPVGPLTSSPAVKRYGGNPLLTASGVPFPCNLAFNAGVAKYRGRYYMAFRYDTFRENDRNKGLIVSGTGLAESEDGLHWRAHENPISFHWKGRELGWVNDARLTVLEGRLYLSFCCNTLHGERPGFAEWKGGDDFDVVCLGIPAQRNMVLCPYRIGGKYWRMERPVTRRGQYDIWASYSPDLIHWGEAELLLGVEDVPFATFKIGAAAPPVETEKGFLLFFHAVDNDPAREITYRSGAKWCSRYTCGAVLLDRKDPFQVLAVTQKPLLVPETDYETGDMNLFWRENVIFPCGAVLEDDTVRLYYGAGDYSTCMAEIRLSELWNEMTPYTRKTREATVSPTELWNGYYGKTEEK
ncbi:MAG: glycosidase [Lentisphaeria bacterium]|nr:glycosidase [Lentisphaeria bacterium]